jgi:serine/threonine protein kinase
MSSDTQKTDVDPPSALPRGTRLGEFELRRVLGIGGFGIVYLAFDHALEREVAVKEYMPASLAGRTETMHVSLRSQSDADTFSLGLKSFVNEARMLASFDHPSLLKVHRFWEANGTAYMAMPVLSGRTIKDVRAGMDQPPDEAWLRALLDPLLGAIDRLHGKGVYHRDIAPDNIVLEDGGLPVLLDFGAARRVISDKSQTLTAILKPAYAPIEQYGEAGSVKQGPWTDFYALGATLHYMLLGRPPSPATARAVHDDHQPLAGQALVGCSENFLQIIDWMLAPRPIDRPQSVAALRDALDGRVLPPVRRPPPVEPQADWQRTQVLGSGSTVAPTQTQRTQTPTVDDDEGTVIMPPRRTTTLPPPPAEPPPPSAPVPPPAAAGSSGSKLVPILLGVVVLGAAAGVLLWPKPAAAPAVASAASVPLAAASVATAPAPPAVAPAAPVATVVAAGTAPKADTVVAAPAPSQSQTPAPAQTPAPSKPTAETRPKPAALKTAPVVRTPDPVDTPKPVVVEAPKPAPPEPTRLASAPASAPALAAAPAKLVGPTERCGKRVLVALWICIQRECGKPELAQHPECVKWRNDQEQKANPMQR